MKLSELQSEESIKLLLIGASGAGKTVGACSFPGPIKVMDFDGKISSAAKFYSADKEKLEQIDFNPYSKVPIKGDVKLGRKAKMQGFFDDLQVYYGLQNTNQPLPFKTIIVDSLTTLSDSIMEDYRYVSQTAVKRPNADQNSMSDYGLLATHFKQIMTGILSLNCNVVFIAHSILAKDESSGTITNEILFPGQMSGKLGIYFEEVYFAKIDSTGKHIWQTKPDPKTSFCRTQRKLPVEIPANYSEIVKVR
jgi:hypothetical protein